MTYNRLIVKSAARRFFEGEPAPVTADPPAPAPAPAPAPPASGKTYTETDFNNLVNTKIAEERRKAEATNRKTVAQLQELQQKTNLTNQEKETLASQIEELSKTYRTAEEQKKTEIETWQKKYDTDTKKHKDDAQSWRNRYEGNLISVDISRAAVDHQAVSPEQIEAFLRPLTRVTERLDDAGKPTGQFITKVKFDDTNAEGQPVTLDLSVNDAVKLMRERATRFGNLFKNATSGGTGTTPNTLPLTSGKFDISKMSPQDYLKNRDAVRAEVRAQQKRG